MGWKDLIAGLRRRISGSRQAAEEEELTPYEILMRDYDIHSIYLHDEQPDLIPQRDAMRRAWCKADFGAYQAAYVTARRQGDLTLSGDHAALAWPQ